jgi:hypothetical protein
MIIEKNLDDFKSNDLIDVACDYCNGNLKRKKKSALYYKSHYCGNACVAAKKTEERKKTFLERTSKNCPSCGKEKDLKEFNKSKSKSDGLNTCCRKCSNKTSKKYYYLNTEKHRENIRIINQKNLKENRQKIFDYYKTHPCVDCGNDNPVVLEFDHRDSSEKIDIVSRMVNSGRSWIKNEIDKCDVRCANCHRIRTSIQFNWYKNIKK